MDERSGCIDGFPKLGLACDHFHMNKFANAKDSNYCYVREEIVRFVNAAPDRVHHRLQPKTILQKTFSENEQRDQACLAAIFITDPSDDMEMIEKRKNRILHNTGVWVLSHPSFSRWLNDGSSILWLHGDPGKGKTMLAISLIRELQSKTRLEGSAAHTAIAYFFCDNKDERRQTALRILQGVIYQILCQRPDQVHHLRSECERQKEHLLSSPNSLQSLWRILQNIFQSSDLHTVYVVIDGLDECEPESSNLLLSMFESYLTPTLDGVEDRRGNPCAIKWLITSRNGDAIRQRLSSHLEIGLEENTKHVNDAVQRFIDENVKQLQRVKHYSLALTQIVEKGLREKAEGTFLWVALACRELSKPTIKSMNTKNVLQRLPSGLTPLYSRVMEQVLGIEDEELTVFAKTILRAMLAAYRPLELQEVAIVANLPEETRNDVERIEEYVDLCGSFVTIRQRTVHFVHSSAKEYLLTLETMASPWLGEEHKMLALNCLHYLSTEVDEAAIAVLCEDVAHFPELSRQRSKPRARAEYPVHFWLDHARLASKSISDEIDVEGPFFQSSSRVRQEWVDQYWNSAHAQWEKKPSGFTSLHVAAYAGLIWLASLLLRSNQSVAVTATDSLGNNALMWASRNGREAVVGLLLREDMDVAAKNLDRVTALYLAADNGHEEVVRILLDHGASVDITDKVGWTPLHRAAYHGHTAVISILLDHGSNIEMQDSSRWTVLQRAVSSGQLSVTKLLLERGANPDVQDREGLSLLNIAAWNGHVDLTALLLQKGANVELGDEQGWTPLQQAAWGGHAAVTKLLLQYGANLHVQNAEGNTALHHATWNGHIEVVRLLLQRNADASISCYNGESPLQQAAWRGHAEVARILLASNVDVNMTSNSGHTALHQAASNGQDALVKLLLEAGADSTIEDDDGATAYSIAKDNHHDSAAELLRARRPSEVNQRVAMPTSDDEGGEPDLIPLDSAIVHALGLQAEQCNIEPHGQAGFSNPSKVTTVVEGETRCYFVKTGPNGKMFEGEQSSHNSFLAWHVTDATRRARFVDRSTQYSPLNLSN